MVNKKRTHIKMMNKKSLNNNNSHEMMKNG